MSNMEQGLVPSVCLSEVTSEPAEGEAVDQPSAEILESIKELSQALENKETASEEGEGEEEEEEDYQSECVIYSDSDASDNSSPYTYIAGNLSYR